MRVTSPLPEEFAQVFTARTVEAIKPGPRSREIPDKLLPGFYLVVQVSGAKSWAVRYRVQGRPRKYTIGSYPAIDLKAARELAQRAFRAVAEGRDPGMEKSQARREAPPDTVEHVARQFLQLHCRRQNRANTIAAAERAFNLHVLPAWGKRLARDITRRDVLDLLDGIVGAGHPIAANRTLAVVRAMFGWAVTRDILPSSPCAGVKRPAPETPRDRVLDDAELAIVWTAAEELGGPFAALIKLLILSGQRRDEVARMEWAEVDLEAGLWRLPAARSKNRKPHDIPLPPQAIEILQALPRFAGGKFVLTTDSGRSAASNYAKNKQRLDRLCPGLTTWTLHDLRRSAASGLARIGTPLPVIEKVLNHASGSFAGIVGIYQRYGFDAEKRKALNAWGRRMAALVSFPESNVIELAARS
jgi:integrase